MPLEVLLHHRNDTDREVTCCTATDLEESYACAYSILLVPVNEEEHCLDTVLYEIRCEFALDAVCCEDVSCGAVFPCRADDRNVLLAGCEYPAVLRVDLVVFLENAASEDLVNIFVRKVSLAFCLCLVPYIYECALETAECLLLRDAGVGNTVVVVVQKFLLLLCGEVSVTRHSVIVRVCYKIHDVLFKVVC